MVFSGITFLVYFFPVFFLVYFLLPGKFRNGWLILSSLLFFSWGAPVFLFTLVGSCMVDYWLAGKFRSDRKKLFFTLAVVFNLALLCYFKYANFFIDNFNFISLTLTGNEFSFAHILLPVGISFLTFHKISFLTDVYRGDCDYPDRFSHYLLYILLFPHLIAGPIVRFREIYPQIFNRDHRLDWQECYYGLLQFVIGLSKKVLIANVLGEFVNQNLDEQTETTGFTQSWMTMLAYSFQLYFDFSGYSDMAIGMARMMGFRFPENFKWPYTSHSITEFWKRWHMTLGSWMRDYLYIPLGGNQKGAVKTYRNLVIVFFLSGLWHGANWNFVVWGMYHGTFLVLDRLFLSRWLSKIPGFVSAALTFVVALTGWVFFRLEDFGDACQYIGTMYSFAIPDWSYISEINPRTITALVIAAVFSFQPAFMQQRLSVLYTGPLYTKFANVTMAVCLVVCYIFCIGELFATGFNPFIYFKF